MIAHRWRVLEKRPPGQAFLCDNYSVPSLWRSLKQLKLELPFDPATLLLGIYLQESKPAFLRDPHRHVYCGTVHDWGEKAASATTSKWSVCYQCTMEYYSAVKKTEILSFVGKQMDPETITLSKISQTQKHEYFMFSLTQNLKKMT